MSRVDLKPRSGARNRATSRQARRARLAPPKERSRNPVVLLPDSTDVAFIEDLELRPDFVRCSDALERLWLSRVR